MRQNHSLNKVIRTIIVVKLIAVVFIIVAETELFYVGEKKLVAEESRSSNQNIRKEQERGGSSRRGFMDDLLNLPRIETSELRREEAARYLDLVERRQQQIEERIVLLERRENTLMELEKSIEQKLVQLEEERRFFGETIQHEKEIKAERLSQLVEFYRGMPPKQAAPVFERLDRDLVVHLFNQLPEKQIMNILGAMNPETSVELTEYFGRLRSGREYDLLKEVNASLIEAFQDCKGM